MKTSLPLLLLIFLSLRLPAYDLELTDKNATARTKALFVNLKSIQDEGQVLFGHQEATTYGRTWSGDENRSDVKDVCGDHPAVIGLDFEKITPDDTSLFLQSKQRLVKSVINTYSQGGITTFSWHMKNPSNGGSFYWEKNPVKVVADILPKGKLHETYKNYLRAVAEVANAFRDETGELIPVIFRPYHEFDGDWFWWGKGHCSRDEFIALWHFTVDYLKDELGVHNFIYAFSPDCRFTTEAEFLDYYPGDDYVDMLGMDNYWDFRPDGADNPALAEMKLRIVSAVANRKNKLAAFTETGLEGITQPNWYTSTLLPILQKVNVCYVLVWRNATDLPHHYYVPTNGHPEEEDFIKFTQSKTIVLMSDLPDLYKH